MYFHGNGETVADYVASGFHSRLISACFGDRSGDACVAVEGAGDASSSVTTSWLSERTLARCRRAESTDIFGRPLRVCHCRVEPFTVGRLSSSSASEFSAELLVVGLLEAGIAGTDFVVERPENVGASAG